MKKSIYNGSSTIQMPRMSDNNSESIYSSEETTMEYDAYSNYTDEEMRQLILEYIFPKFYHWVFILLFFIVFVVGIVGNFLVCYSVWKCRNLKTVTNYFLVNLAAADFLVVLICLPLTVTHDVTQSWFLGLAMCKIVGYLQRVSVFVSVLTLTAISVERYLAICHPLTYRGTKFKTRLALVVIWLISMTVPIPDLFALSLKHDDEVRETLRPLLTRCGVNNHEFELNFTIFLISAFYVLPLVIMAFAYVQIARCLWSSTSTGSAASENLRNIRNRCVEDQLRTRRRTAKMLIVVVISFGLCYLPVYLLNIARYMKLTELLNDNLPALYSVTWTARWLCYFNSAANPVIYNFMSGKFRNQFKVACFSCHRCLRCSCCRPADDGQHISQYSKCPSQSLAKTGHIALTSLNSASTRRQSSRSTSS